MVWPYGIWPYAVNMQLEDPSRGKQHTKNTKKDKKEKEAEMEAHQNYPWHLYGYPLTHTAAIPAYSQAGMYDPYDRPHFYVPTPQGLYWPYAATAMDREQEDENCKDKGKSKKKNTDAKKSTPEKGIEAVWHYLYPGQAAEHDHGWRDANGVTHFNWVGRTRAEVTEDDVHVAVNSGKTNKGEMIPKAAKPGDMFWVQRSDGLSSLHNFAEITTSMKGDWIKDRNHGHMYFSKSAAVSSSSDSDTDSDCD